MLVVRAIQKDDVEALFELVQQAESGLTTLKISKTSLAERVAESLLAFAKEHATPQGQPYVFVMEELATGALVGTSSIYAKVGGFQPFYSYEIRKTVKESKKLNLRKEIEALHLSAEHDGPTEIGSLFLSPDFWGGGNGRVLALSRFMFIADYPGRFENEIIAELRGVVDEQGRSPLWTALGSHFFQMKYPKADTLSTTDKRIIADLMPQHPIYIPLLPRVAQGVIGKVHKRTEPALALLKQEGFEYRGVVDIFDGGPAVHCEVKNVRTVRESRLMKIAEVVPEIENNANNHHTDHLLSNGRLDFRCCRGSVRIDGDAVSIEADTASSLRVSVGDTLRVVTLRPQNL